MNYRRLGRNGPEVSAIGMGRGSQSVRFGEPLEATFYAAIRRALDLGITFFDSSDAYWNSRHEVLLGRALKGQRALVTSKFGNIDLPDGKKAMDGRPEYVYAACDASLKRLGREVIDLYYMHRVDPNVPVAETVGAMARLIEAGKIRYIGLCEASPAAIRQAQREHSIAAVQTEYSLWFRGVEQEVLPVCRELGIGFVPYAPLGRGLLTGAIKNVDDLPPDDRRRSHPRFLPDNLARNVKMVRELESLAMARGATAAQVALAWLIARGDGIVPIPGTNHASNVELNAGAADLDLNAAEMERLGEVFAIGAGAGDRYPRSLIEKWGI